MNVEVKTELNAAEIKELVKEDLPPEEKIRKMIGNYKSLTEQERLTVDRYYFLRAANVSEDETQKFYFFWGKGERIHPEVIDDQHPIFCPIHRMRLKTLGEKAQEYQRYVIWRE